MTREDKIHFVLAIFCLGIAFGAGYMSGFHISGYQIVIPTVQVVFDPDLGCSRLVVDGELRPPGGTMGEACKRDLEANGTE